MKLRLSLSLRHALVVCMGLVALPTQADTEVLNDSYSGWDASGFATEQNKDLSLEGNFAIPVNSWGYGGGFSWTATENATYRMGGSGSIDIQNACYLTISGASQFIIESGVEVKNSVYGQNTGEERIYDTGRLAVQDGANVVFKGTISDGITVEVSSSDNSSSIDFREALTFGNGIDLYFSGGNILVNEYVTSGDVLGGDLVYNEIWEYGRAKLVGDLTLAGGALHLQQGVLDVEGTVSLTETTVVDIGNMLDLTEGSILFTCQEITGDLSNLVLSHIQYDESFNSAYIPVNQYTVESMAYGDGYALYLAAASDTPSIPEPTTATLSLFALAGLAARRRRK